jgi:hypothetical protein
MRDKGSRENGGGRNAAPVCSNISGDALRMRIFGGEIPLGNFLNDRIRV